MSADTTTTTTTTTPVHIQEEEEEEEQSAVVLDILFAPGDAIACKKFEFQDKTITMAIRQHQGGNAVEKLSPDEIQAIKEEEEKKFLLFYQSILNKCLISFQEVSDSNTNKSSGHVNVPFAHLMTRLRYTQDIQDQEKKVLIPVVEDFLSGPYSCRLDSLAFGAWLDEIQQPTEKKEKEKEEEEGKDTSSSSQSEPTKNILQFLKATLTTLTKAPTDQGPGHFEDPTTMRISNNAAGFVDAILDDIVSVPTLLPNSIIPLMLCFTDGDSDCFSNSLALIKLLTSLVVSYQQLRHMDMRSDSCYVGPELPQEKLVRIMDTLGCTTERIKKDFFEFLTSASTSLMDPLQSYAKILGMYMSEDPDQRPENYEEFFMQHSDEKTRQKIDTLIKSYADACFRVNMALVNACECACLNLYVHHALNLEKHNVPEASMSQKDMPHHYESGEEGKTLTCARWVVNAPWSDMCMSYNETAPISLAGFNDSKSKGSGFLFGESISQLSKWSGEQKRFASWFQQSTRQRFPDGLDAIGEIFIMHDTRMLEVARTYLRVYDEKMMRIQYKRDDLQEGMTSLTADKCFFENKGNESQQDNKSLSVDGGCMSKKTAFECLFTTTEFLWSCYSEIALRRSYRDDDKKEIK